MPENKRARGGFVGTAVGTAMTVAQGTHPEWFGNHPLILPVSLLVLFVSLLIWITQYSWVQKILGLSFAVPAKKEDKTTELASALRDLDSSIDAGLESSKQAGAQTRLLGHFAAESRGLERFLEEIRDRWRDAGETLSHPISTELSDWKDFSREDAMKLNGLLRDFKGLYHNHLEYVRLEFPGLDSPLVRIGYPSNAEYHQVIYAIKDHAETLERIATQAWENNEPMKGIDAKAS